MTTVTQHFPVVLIQHADLHLVCYSEEDGAVRFRANKCFGVYHHEQVSLAIEFLLSSSPSNNA